MRRRSTFAFWLRGAALCAFTLCLFSAPSANPEKKKIILRFLNAKSGKAIIGVDIFLFAWNVPEYRAEAKDTVLHKMIRTDKGGRITLELPDPVPKHLGFNNVFDLRGCSVGKFDLDEAFLARVSASGVVVPFSEKCGALKWKPVARPGEIVVVDIPLTTWDKMKREIP